MILQKGRIGDAFCLLRKYYDSCVLNLYTNVYLENNKDNKSILVEDVVRWINGTKILPHKDFRSMLPYLQKSGKSKEIIGLVFKDQGYQETRQRCNDHTHYSYFNNVLVNDNRVHLDDRIDRLDAFQKDLENIFILHISCIFYINEHYMMSSDYIDSLEVGMQPEEASQYWVADFIQNIFDELISIKRRDIADLIKKNTAMKLA